MNHIVITTPRLRIREYCYDDFEAVHSYSRLYDVARFMKWGPNTEEQTMSFLERAIGNATEEPRLHYELVATLRGSDRAIGGCGLHVRSVEDGSCEIGYCFAPQAQGHGYATEAARAMIEFGFRRLPIHRLFARIDAENLRSVGVAERLGMRREGHLKEAEFIRGTWRDMLIYAVLIGEWQKAGA